MAKKDSSYSKGGWGESKNSSQSSYKSSFFNWDKWSSGYKYVPPIRKEIVKPYLNWYDGDKIVRGIHGDIEFVNKIADTKIAKSLGMSPDMKIRDKTRDMYKEIVPDHLIQDIYSIYYNKSSNIEFTELKDSNEVKFKLLQNINNSLLKIVSNNNPIASFMYTKEISHFLFEELLNQLTPQEQKDLKDSMKDCNTGESKEKKDGEGKGNGKGKKGNKNGGNKKGKSSGKGNQQNESDSEESEEEDEEDNDSEGDNEDGSNDESRDNKSNSNGQGEDSDDDEGEDGNPKNESKQKETDSDQGEDSNNNGKPSNSSSKGSSKDGHRSNPLTGHNAEENVDPNNNRKKQNQEPKTREEVLAEKIDNIFSKPEVQQKFDEAIMKADQLMSDLEKAGIDLSKDGLSQIAELSNINKIRDDIAALTMNKRAISEAIKQVLDNSSNYFSKKSTIKDIDFFEADEIDEIYGMEYIHPVFRSTMLDRLSTEERKYQGRIDLFIDVSGSMGSNSGISGVSNMLFAKSIALAMYNMDLLNNLYTFDTRVTKVEVSELNILMIGYGGGTDIDTVVNHVINESKNNAICLTDGEDDVSKYDERIFFMGTVGVMFGYFSSSNAGQKYIENNQCINFNGDTSTLITRKLLESQGRWRSY